MAMYLGMAWTLRSICAGAEQGVPSPWGPFPDRRKHGGGANEMPRTGVVHAPSMPQAMLKWVLIGQIIT